MPELDSWSELASFATELLQRPDRLDALQQQVFSWWQDYKQGLKRQVESRLAAVL
jgi:hypothetical protein